MNTRAWDRDAARCVNFALVMTRLAGSPARTPARWGAVAVLGARSAPKNTAHQPRGGAPWLVVCAVAMLATSSAYAQQPQDGSTQPVASEAAVPQDRGDGFVDEAREWAEETQIVGRITGEVEGWYPRLGGMTRGAGFALGPGYRWFVTDDMLVDVSAGISFKGYKAADVEVRWLQAFDDRVELWTNYRFEDFSQEDFFGTGFDSSLDARTSYDFDSSEISAIGLVTPASWLETGVRVGYMSPEIGPGTDENYPSIEELFTDGAAPGLATQPNFLHTTFFAGIDSRDQGGRPRSGGLYEASFGIWDDRTLQQYDFRRFDASATHWLPLVPSKAHVLMGRLGVGYANNETGERVPFYFLPYVGGVDTIRSFREFRFKDENAIWMTAEYTWAPFEYVSLAAFVDAGKVNADWNDINLSGMKSGYGFGFRVHTDEMTFARFDFATGGGDGWQAFIKLGPRF